MIEKLETLVALSKTGTMMAAATMLKVSQSAVSKRIDMLEHYYGRRLIERIQRELNAFALGGRLPRVHGIHDHVVQVCGSQTHLAGCITNCAASITVHTGSARRAGSAAAAMAPELNGHTGLNL